MTLRLSFCISLLLLAVPLAVRAETVTTTHEVTLTNGKCLLGNVSDDSDDLTLVLTIGELGTVRVPRSRVERVTPKAGSIELPLSARPSGPTTEIQRPKKDSEKEQPVGSAKAGVERPDPLPERQAEIDRAIFELGRWRTRNRVRAERRLKAIGIDAVDSLIEVANDHPFHGMRRAVFRIFLTVDDERTLPVALVGLTDPDRFVRADAARLLRNLTGRRFRFDPDDHLTQRRRAVDRWADHLVEREGARRE